MTFVVASPGVSGKRRCGEKTLAKTKARFNLRHRVALSCLSSGLASLPVRSEESRLDGGHSSDESLSLSTGSRAFLTINAVSASNSVVYVYAVNVIEAITFVEIMFRKLSDR